MPVRRREQEPLDGGVVGRTVPVEAALELARDAPANDATIEGLLLAAADGHL